MITDARIVSGRAHQGGGIHAQSNSAIALYDSIIRNNTATKEGGGLLLDSSEGNVNETIFEGNVASIGGSIIMKNSSLQLTKSVLEYDRATLAGGSIAANQNNSLIILKTSLLNTKTKNGGSIWLSGSTLNANALKVSNCEAKKAGGAIFANASSIVLCANCTFDKNRAGKKRGAIAFHFLGAPLSRAAAERLHVQRKQCQYWWYSNCPKANNS